MDMFPYITYVGTSLSSIEGGFVNVILQTSVDCLLTLFTLITDMYQLVSAFIFSVCVLPTLM